jgi:hypothetical protein
LPHESEKIEKHSCRLPLEKSKQNYASKNLKLIKETGKLNDIYVGERINNIKQQRDYF